MVKAEKVCQLIVRMPLQVLQGHVLGSLGSAVSADLLEVALLPTGPALHDVGLAIGISVLAAAPAARVPAAAKGRPLLDACLFAGSFLNFL